MKHFEYRKCFCLINVSLVLFYFNLFGQGRELIKKTITLDDGKQNLYSKNPDWTASGSVIDRLSWISIGTGVDYAMADNALGENMFIGIGGWTCRLEFVRSWVTALYAARLHTLGVRHLYSVAGPKDLGYQSREISTLDLAHHVLLQIQSDTTCKRIIVAAHSSGAYVAHVLFQDLYDGTGIDSSHYTDGKILYFLLDEPLGSYPAVELTNASADRLGHIYGVYAVISSQNLYSYAPNQMIALGNKYGSRSSTVVIDASTSDCIATMCLHFTMINQKPYQHDWYDPRDYGSINSDHPVQTTYLDVITELKDDPQQPLTTGLWQNYPNPFNPSTTIKYSISKRSYITLKIYDMLGREIEALVNSVKPAGNYQVEFYAVDLPSGVYFYRIQAGSFNQVRKMLLIK